MALTFTPEDGTALAAANSYASVAQATAYFEGHLYPGGWTASSSKEEALVMATRLLDARTIWIGDKKTKAQGLQWPRESVEHDGFEVATNEIPQEIINTVSELAMLLIANDLTEEVEQNSLAGIGLGKGALEIEFKDNRDKKQIPIIVDDLLRGLGRVNTGGGFNIVQARR